MANTMDDMQKFGKDGADGTMKSFGSWSRGAQAITAEMVDYAKKSYEDGAAALEKLAGVKSLESAMEIQTTFARSAYEGFVAQATKMGGLYGDLAREACKPFESYAAMATPAK